MTTSLWKPAGVALGLFASLLSGWAANPGDLDTQPGLVKREFIAERPAFASSHASTIEETPAGLVAAWFGGTDEGRPDVVIYVARQDKGGWTVPVEVANGIQADGKKRYPCWNPVLYQRPDGPLLLFFKVGPNPSDWWGMLTTSTNHGQTWTPAQRLPDGQLGPVRNKPVPWDNGALLCGSSTEKRGWVAHLEWTADWGKTWERSGPLNELRDFGAIQPTILKWPSGKVQLLHRTKQGVVSENWMDKDWKTWTPMKATSLPNPNSGIDAVMLRDGRALLVYNHTARGRSPLNVACSKDGVSWTSALVLENQPGEYSYPAVIQGRDDLVHITYTWKRQKIRHVVADPAKF